MLIITNDLNPNDWFLIPDSVKKYFGSNTGMANLTGNQWDDGCLVDHIIDGEKTMTAIFYDFKNIIDEAVSSSEPFGERGYVFIAGMRLNPNRIIHHTDASGNWFLDGEPQEPEDVEVDHDFTAWEMIKNMMDEGIMVRILLFMPPTTIGNAAGFNAHAADHFFLASLVKQHNETLRNNNPECSNDIGVVFLDARLPTDTMLNNTMSSHHQKFIVIRGVENSVAYCGGVDLAYTRLNSFKFEGDNQSGNSIPARNININMTGVPMPTEDKQESDLPEEVYGWSGAGANSEEEAPERPPRFQIWHDQHLRLRGPIVSTLEKIFVERWNDYGPVTWIPDGTSMIEQQAGGVISSSFNATQQKKEKGFFWDSDILIPKPLENTVTLFAPITEAAQSVYGIYGTIDNGEPGTSKVQAWQTIPRLGLRVGKKIDGEFCNEGEDYPYQEGEFSVMAGITKAIESSEDLIFIFDQYYWLLPHAASLIKQLNDKPNLRIIIILPPYSDLGNERMGLRQHAYRKNALDFFWKFGDYIRNNRVMIFNLWNHEKNLGIYCHAKVHAFDQALLVCGSANINWRSFTNDTELNCAVLDKNVIRNFYRNIWMYLFNTDFPKSNIDFELDWWSGDFFSQFQLAYARTETTGNLILDIFYDQDESLPLSDFSSGEILEPDVRIKRGYNMFPAYYGTLDPKAISDEIPRDELDDYDEKYDKEKKNREGKYYFEEDLSSIVENLESGKRFREDTR